MGYASLGECVRDLERSRQLVRVDVEVDPYLEMAEIQRRVYQVQGPALLFTRPRGCAFPMVSNLFGTLARTRFMFRDMLDAVRHLVELKIDPRAFLQNPWRYRDIPRALWSMRPKLTRSGPVLEGTTSVSQLPQLVSWPNDGGAFVTLPAVYTEDVDQPGWQRSNLGMYRIQLSGNQYRLDEQVGLHYQIHRGIGVHHAKAIARGKPFQVNIAVGGPPALTLSAVMPLPEGLSELTFAGALGGRRVRLVPQAGHLPLLADADFIISGTVDPDLQLPEGPFGDHLGYYSLVHPFPVLNVRAVYHRRDAIWPFTVVGRPPQEDTSFGAIIHEITGPIIPTVVPGVRAVHAVDAAGVHPLLLALGSERYTPYQQRRRPQELLTCAHALLGQGQLSLAKFLLILAHEDAPGLDIHDIPGFLQHLLERVDWTNDLHFSTRTTIDTLDYSGEGLNAGSKVVIAAAGPARRTLARELPADLQLPEGFSQPRVVLPGVLAVQAPAYQPGGEVEVHLRAFAEFYRADDPINAFPLITLVDDSDFAAARLNNWLWLTFTRANPASDIYGIEAQTWQKHWGCRGSLVMDARIKPHHAPPLVEDPAITRRIDALAARGGPLHGIL